MVEKSVVYICICIYTNFFFCFIRQMVPVKNGKIEIGDIKYSGEYQSSRELSSRGSRAWVVFPATFHFFPPSLSLSLSFSFHPLASIDPRPLFYLSNSRLILEIISYFTIKSATRAGRPPMVPFRRPPTQFPVECFEIKLIAVIKLLETYRSGGGGAR